MSILYNSIFASVLLAASCAPNATAKPQLEERVEQVENLKQIPKNLASFLKEKDVKIRRIKDKSVSIHIYGDEYLFVNGSYNDFRNQITLPMDDDSAIIHESGHALWDYTGADSIFNSIDYEGPSRNEFISAIYKTKHYNRLINKILKMHAQISHCKLLEKFKDKEIQRKISERYAEVIEGSAVSYHKFILYARTLGEEISESEIDREAVNETFTALFTSWVKGKHNPLTHMFDSILYKGECLKN